MSHYNGSFGSRVTDVEVCVEARAFPRAGDDAEVLGSGAPKLNISTGPEGTGRAKRQVSTHDL